MDHPTGGGWDTRQHLGVLPKHHMAGLVEGVGSRGGPGWLPEPWAAPRIPGPGEGGPALQNKRKLGARSFLKKNQKTQPQKTHETDHNVDCSFFGVCVCVSGTGSFNVFKAGAHGLSYPPYAMKLRYDEGGVD